MRLSPEIKPFPDKKYQIIYADPPWQYNDKAAAGKRGACFKYPVQTMEWLESLPVSSISDDNCILFLWVTLPKLNECWDLIKKWGFEYKTGGFVWIKLNKRVLTFFWGMGRWTRANSEICLIATKGKPTRISKSVHSVVSAPIGKHSEKPEEVRQRIVELMGDLPRIELFARKESPGWDVWGNEV